MKRQSIWRMEVHWKVSELCLLGGSLAVWLVGMTCNITVRLANRGKMPVTAFPGDFAPGQTATHFSALVQSARLSFLWDRFNVGTNIISIGDILMALGLFAVIFFCTMIIVRMIKEAKEILKL
jgi:Family of unknown function (DUF5317)